MRERDSLTRLLARHGAGSGERAAPRADARAATGRSICSTPRQKSDSWTRRSRYSLHYVLWRTLLRTSFESGATLCSGKGDPIVPCPIGQIPPMWATPNHQPPRPANRYH